MATAKYKIGEYVQVLNEDHAYNSIKGKIERVKEDDKKETDYSIVSDDAKHSFDASEGDVQTLEIPKSEMTARARALKDKRRKGRENAERDIRNPILTESIAGNDNLDYAPNDPLTPPVPEPASVVVGERTPKTATLGGGSATPLAPSPRPERGRTGR